MSSSVFKRIRFHPLPGEQSSKDEGKRKAGKHFELQRAKCLLLKMSPQMFENVIIKISCIKRMDLLG